MAITLIVGKPGAGKSYEAVRNHVLPDLRSGRKIITNLPLNLQRIREEWPMMNMGLIEIREPKPGSLRPFSTAQDFADDWRDEAGYGAHFIIDEAHEAFPKESKDKAVLELFTMHRHRGIDITLITQQVPQLRRDIVGLCRTVIELQNNANIGFGSGSYRKWVKDGYGKSAAVMSGPSVQKYEKKIFEFYASQTQGGKGEKVKAARSIFLRPLFLIFYAMILLVVGMVVSFKPWRILSDPSGQKVKAEQVEVVTPPQPAVVKVEKPVVTAPVVVNVPEPKPVTPPPVQAVAIPEPEPEEPQEPVYDDGELKVENVTFVQMGRFGDRCRALPIVNGRLTESWEWASLGWEWEDIPNEGKARKKYGSCTLRITRGEYAMEWYSEPLAPPFTPPKRFGARSAARNPSPSKTVVTPDIVGAVNQMMPFASTSEKDDKKDEKKSSPEREH